MKRGATVEMEPAAADPRPGRRTKRPEKSEEPKGSEETERREAWRTAFSSI